jgi:hypothetical protein
MITLLDFEKGEVHTYNVSLKFNWDNVEDFLEECGHNLNNCQYMTTPTPHEYLTHEIWTP